jgi:hypothetical protein
MNYYIKKKNVFNLFYQRYQSNKKERKKIEYFEKNNFNFNFSFLISVVN